MRRFARVLVGCALLAGAATAPILASGARGGASLQPISVSVPRTLKVSSGAMDTNVEVTIVCDPGSDLVLGGALNSDGRFVNENEGYHYQSAVNRHHVFACTGKRQQVGMYFYTTSARTFTADKAISKKAKLSVQVYSQSEDGSDHVLRYEAPTQIVELEVRD